MTYQTTDPEGAQALLDTGYVYVDVRSVQEFEAGHPPGAYNVPILFQTAGGMQPNPDFVAAMQRHFSKDQKIVFGCKAGGRSARACEIMATQGYRTLVNMEGGFHGAYDMGGALLQAGWAACGLPTATEADPTRTWKALSGG
jgi:rhodanese-related sulfurtransferase